MCGIAGVRRLGGDPVDPGQLRAMVGRLHHRGPDGEGYWLEGPVALGHRRLAIIDVDGSPQPMPSADGRLQVVFNGEILNYRELRSELAYPFRTAGDTEVLLALFDAYGAEGVNRIDGQFAYALADTKTHELWLFRDRLGILPLYYYADDRVFAFASEVKALLPALPSPAAVDETSLDAYLTHRAVPAPATLFRGIRKLSPGHRLHLDARGRVTVERYWSLPETPPARVPPHEAVDRVAGAVEAAVRRGMVADVPVGAYLSGGVDSSLIVALMARQSGDLVHTFAAGFDDPRFDELPVARRVSELLGTNHHEVNVRPQDFREQWHTLTWHRDAPLSEPADVAVFELARRAREHVKVVLSGEGSDELFAGYPKHRAARIAAVAGLVPARPRARVASTAAAFLGTRADRLRIALRAVSAPTPSERDIAWFAPFTAAERADLLGASAAAPPPPDDRLPGFDPVDRMLRLDSRSWLADNLLERGDRMSMAASLELRPPFVDHHVAELAFGLPSDIKVRRGTGKWVVKEVARRYLPDDIVDRRKVGFRVPLDNWFRGGLEDLARDLLDSPSSFVSGVMDRRTVRRLLDAHRREAANEGIRIWTLLGLEVWHDVFFGTGRDRRPAAAPLAHDVQ